MPDFLEVEDVIVLHELSLERYGGAEGIRDEGLLESAVAQPQAGFGGEFVHRTLLEMGAAYLFHLAKNHPFVDGNKRTALAAALVFYDRNGLGIREDESATEQLYELTMAVAEGRLGKAEIAEKFRELLSA